MEIVGAEIVLINSVLVRIQCLWSVDSVEHASIAGCVVILKLFYFMFGRKGMARFVLEMDHPSGMNFCKGR